MLEFKIWELVKFWGFICIYIRRKFDWNDKIYNWKFVEIEILRLKGGIILKKKFLKIIMILVLVVLYIIEGFFFYK